MLIFSLLMSVVLVGAALVQLAFALLFRHHFPSRPVHRYQPSNQQSHPQSDLAGSGVTQPAVAVLISLRGCDPSLRDCLRGLLNQNYPDFEIYVIVDDQPDSATDWIGDLQREVAPQVPLHIHSLDVRIDRCSLKCNALLNGWEQISAADRYQYLLLLDADVTPPVNWIRDLIGPLEADSQIGLVSGAQWFEPSAGCSWGALVRSTWNAGALVPTVVFHNPWAGSLAMRVADVRRGEIPAAWQTSIVDDGPLGDCYNRLGLQRHFAPSLIMVNQENCSFAFARQWMTRMLLWSRLYERNYFLSVLHSLFSTTTMTVLFAVLVWSIVQQQWLIASFTAVGLITSGILSVAALLAVRQVVVISQRYQGLSLPALSAAQLFWLFWAVPITQWMYLDACLRALFAKKIRWRGVDYQVEAKDNVRIIRIAPLDSHSVKNKLSV